MSSRKEASILRGARPEDRSSFKLANASLQKSGGRVSYMLYKLACPTLIHPEASAERNTMHRGRLRLASSTDAMDWPRASRGVIECRQRALPRARSPILRQRPLQRCVRHRRRASSERDRELGPSHRRARTWAQHGYWRLSRQYARRPCERRAVPLRARTAQGRSRRGRLQSPVTRPERSSRPVRAGQCLGSHTTRTRRREKALTQRRRSRRTRTGRISGSFPRTARLRYASCGKRIIKGARLHVSTTAYARAFPSIG